MPPVKLELEVPTQFNTAASLGQKEVALIGYYACFGISNLRIQHLMHKKWAKWFTEELIASHVAAIEHTQGWKFDHLFVRSEHIKVGHWMGGVLEGHLPGTKGLRDMRHIVEWEDWEKSLRYVIHLYMFSFQS